MTELKKSKEQFFVALRCMLKTYDSMKEISAQMKEHYPEYDALQKTLDSYDDFYEWLQGEID